MAEIENEGSPRSPSLINIDPTDIAIQASLEQYLQNQLAGSPADELSLTKHISGLYREIINRPSHFRTQNLHDSQEHSLIKNLIGARARCEGWEPTETAGTMGEQNNPIKNFKRLRAGHGVIARIACKTTSNNDYHHHYYTFSPFSRPYQTSLISNLLLSRGSNSLLKDLLGNNFSEIEIYFL